MATFLHHLSLYISAVLEHWHVLLFGSLLTGFIEAIERYREAEMPKRWWLVFAALGLISAMFMAWEEEHDRADKFGEDVKTVSSDRDTWHGKADAKDVEIGRRDQDIKRRDEIIYGNFAVMGANQKSVNSLAEKVLEATKQEPLKIRSFRVPSYSDVHGAFVLITNKTVTPIKLVGYCDEFVTSVEAGFLEKGTATMSSGGGLSPDGHSFSATILSPAWTPDVPLIVTLSKITPTADDFGTCTFRLR